MPETQARGTTMRILILTTYFQPESAANATLMTLLAEELTQLGHEVTVITAMPHYDTNRIFDGYRGRLWMREQRGAVQVKRVTLYVPPEKGRLLGRLFNYLSFNALSTLAGLLTRRHDILFVPSPPLTNGVSGFLLSRLRGMPFVYNVQDIYPDVAVRLGVLTNRRVIRLFEQMERFVYRKAAAVSVISNNFARNLRQKGVPETKLRVIPNFVDAEFMTPGPRCNAFSREQGLDAKFVALFAGNMGLSQGLETVLEAAERLRDVPEIVFLIIGNGTTKPALVALAEARRLENVRFLPFQPYERVPEFYAASDVCLIPLRKGLTEDSVPSKLFTIMGMGRPVVASVDEGSDTARMIGEAGCGVCVEPEDACALADAILRMHNDPAGAAVMGAQGRAFVEARYTRKAVAKQYAALFIELATGRGLNRKDAKKSPRDSTG